MAHEAGGPGGKKFAIVLALFRVVFVVLFAVFGTYHDDAKPWNKSEPGLGDTGHGTAGRAVGPTAEFPARDYYPMFQDVHVMMFIGFGYLMTFLRKYGYSSLGINFLLAAFVLQWATLMKGFLSLEGWTFKISLYSLLQADFTAAVILITFGAVLGKLSPLQYLIMAFIEVPIMCVNEWIGGHKFGTVDVGGSIFVHVFGAYFGLACSRMLYRREYAVSEFNTLKFNTKTTDLFSMIGTVFLWMYWPSFNSAVAPEELQQRAIINTYLALAACCCVTFVCSALFCKGRFSMELVQNATLAGGVAIGTTADMMVRPYGAIIIGCGAGILSCVGFHFLSSVIEKKLKIHDTCGVNNLHGMPGILAALISAVVVAFASKADYGGDRIYKNFPLLEGNPDAGHGVFANRTPMIQAGYQLAALALTLAMAIVSGIITGAIIRMKIWDPLSGPAHFEDGEYWSLPDPPSLEQEDEIRDRLRNVGREHYEVAVTVPLTKGFPAPRDNNA